MFYILNTPILTEYGTYNFVRITVDMAKEMVNDYTEKFTSAVGHQGTAEIISRLLNVNVPMNRVAIKMQPGDSAIVFRLLERLPEGKILSAEELDVIPYEFGLLERGE